MPEYVLDQHNKGERERLALMSELLDPMQRRLIEGLGLGWTQTIALTTVAGRAAKDRLDD